MIFHDFSRKVSYSFDLEVQRHLLGVEGLQRLPCPLLLGKGFALGVVAQQLPSYCCIASFLYNLVVTKHARRLSGQLPLTSVGEWCASVVKLH